MFGFGDLETLGKKKRKTYLEDLPTFARNLLQTDAWRLFFVDAGDGVWGSYPREANGEYPQKLCNIGATPEYNRFEWKKTYMLIDQGD